MHDDFLTRAHIKKNEYLLKTEELFVTHKNSWFADFTAHFFDVCTQVRQYQKESAFSAVSYLEYTMLYSNFILRNYVADVFVYGEKSYLDKGQRFVSGYDISFLFVYFNQLWDELISLRKMYVGQVTAQEITAYMMETLPDFYSYLPNIARFAIADAVEQSPFIDIEKNEEFMVNVGDYMGKTETVFCENKNKDEKKLAEWFTEQLWNKCIFGDYSSLNFSEKAFLYTDFRYASFKESALVNTNFEGSMLIGANFRKALMNGACLDNCSIYEADFTGADLKNARFVNARGKVGLSDNKLWKFVGFLPVSFRNADLSGADFSGANLKGADFSGAVLTDANFSGAILDDAIFSDKNIPNH